jgi:hypothetical protein
MAAAAFERDWPARASTVALVLLPILLVGLVALARAGGLHAPPGPPTAVTLAGGAQAVTTAQLTEAAAEVLTSALTDGAGIEFEIVQTSTISARLDGPPVEIPDPTDRSATLGSAPRYVMGTLIERGLATPDGYWMELLHGPEPGAETDFDVAKAQVSRQALVRDGTRYRNDGQGWHETDRLPGIGLDPVTLAELPRLIEAAAAGTDVALRGQPDRSRGRPDRAARARDGGHRSCPGRGHHRRAQGTAGSAGPGRGDPDQCDQPARDHRGRSR